MIRKPLSAMPSPSARPPPWQVQAPPPVVTKRRRRTFQENASADESDSDSDSGISDDMDIDEPANAAGGDDAFKEILDGVGDIRPLAKKSHGEAQAAKLGYSTKLVSKWYEHLCPAGSCPERWAEFDNVDDERADLDARTRKVPIIHRHRFVKKHWITESVTIQDPAIRQVLSTVLAKYQDLDLDLISWTFTPPFMPLVHRWEELKAYYASLPKGDAKKNAAAALLTFITPIIAPSVISRQHTQATGKVSFDNVWQIFPPGSIVKTKFYGADVICRVVKYKKRMTDTGPQWALTLEYVDWNGEKAGWTSTTMSIHYYSGYKKVTGLPVFPVSFAPDEAKIREESVARGRKWAGLRGYHFKVANGTKILLETSAPQQRPVSGKVCIDAYAYYRSCNIVKPHLRPLAAGKIDVDDEHLSDNGDEEVVSVDGFSSSFKVAQVEASSKPKGPSERNEDLAPLTDDELLMTTPWIKGFDLKSKSFCELNVSEVRDMVWNDEAFDKLVLPGGEKELAWTFVENKSQSTSDFDDFVADKGRGLIILMFGPPGVGKTFTAEAVSERSRVPLYSMSAGDLGVQPSEVEAALERALELCRMWNAMLLLDEADVFLGERTSESLARNELVSIFLTKLEYYQGILFLTTNRISSIDHAFQSRVDLFLPYHDLRPEARRQVWVNFIEKAGREKFELTDDSLNELSQLRLNGREIKNLIKSAQLLSMKNLGGKVPVDRLLLLANKRVEALKELDVKPSSG